MELRSDMLGGMRSRVGICARKFIFATVVAAFSSLLASSFALAEEPLELPAAGAAAPGTEAMAGEDPAVEIEACGRKESITRLCAFPFVTAAMTAEATKYPLLKEEHERHNFCVSTDPDFQALESERGDENLEEEIEADQGDDIPTKIRFHLSVSGRMVQERFIGVRNDAAFVSRKGFTRDFVRGALAEMKLKFQKEKDKISEVSTAGFEAIALNRVMELSAVSCELKRMAEKDRRIENRIAKVIVEGEFTQGKYGQGSPYAPSPSLLSDITGVDPDASLPDYPGVPQLKLVPPDDALAAFRART